MNEQKIIDSFETYLKEKGFLYESLSLSVFPDIFIGFYRHIEFDEVSKEDDGDTLLFQYGIYNFEAVSAFQINFTRQFYEIYNDDCHRIYQLGINFFYQPDEFGDIRSFNEWSSNHSDLDEFRNVIVKSAGFEKALNKLPLKKEIRIDLI